MSIEQGNLIFSTIAGSHLYGLAHEGSDRDVYYVYEGSGRNLRHTMKGDDDSVRGSLDAFLLRAYTGSHQSVEALFSQKKEWAPGMKERWGPLVENINIRGPEVFAKYERTIKKFCFGDLKRRTHAGRLSLNLQSLRYDGRFDPTLTETEVVMVRAYAKTWEGEDLWNLLSRY